MSVVTFRPQRPRSGRRAMVLAVVAVFVVGTAIGAAIAKPDLFEGARCFVAGEIKANLSSGGERIYHTPADRYYGATSINWMRGERRFCSAADARAAGRRRALV